MICDEDFISRWLREVSERFRSGASPSQQKILLCENRPTKVSSPTATVKVSSETVRKTTGTVSWVKGDALSDLLDLLASGRTVPSQQHLADRWDRPKQTVSRWLREWRSIGVIPSAVRTGRCKATVPRRALVPA